MIYKHIVSYPGVTFNILKNIFELSDGGLRYHLEYLEKSNKISCGLEKGNRCYYPHNNVVNVPISSPGSSEMNKLTLPQEKILETIKDQPGINQKELAVRTKLNRFLVAKNINQLIGMNLVNKYQYGKNVCYEYIPDDELKFKIIKRLVIKLLKGEIDEETFLKLKRKLDVE
jgi:predicted transcriptional regulator